MTWLRLMFREWRIQRLKVRIVGLEETLPLLRDMARICPNNYYNDRLLWTLAELGELRLRLLFLLETP